MAQSPVCGALRRLRRTAWGRQAEGQRASVGTCSSTRIWGRGRSHASTCVSIACIRDAPMPTNPRSPHRHRRVISPTPGRTPFPPTRSTYRKTSPSLHAPSRGPRRSTRQPPARETLHNPARQPRPRTSANRAGHIPSADRETQATAARFTHATGATCDTQQISRSGRTWTGARRITTGRDAPEGPHRPPP